MVASSSSTSSSAALAGSLVGCCVCAAGIYWWASKQRHAASLLAHDLDKVQVSEQHPPTQGCLTTHTHTRQAGASAAPALACVHYPSPGVAGKGKGEPSSGPHRPHPGREGAKEGAAAAAAADTAACSRGRQCSSRRHRPWPCKHQRQQLRIPFPAHRLHPLLLLHEVRRVMSHDGE